MPAFLQVAFLHISICPFLLQFLGLAVLSGPQFLSFGLKAVYFGGLVSVPWWPFGHLLSAVLMVCGCLGGCPVVSLAASLCWPCSRVLVQYAESCSGAFGRSCSLGSSVEIGLESGSSGGCGPVV